MAENEASPQAESEAPTTPEGGTGEPAPQVAASAGTEPPAPAAPVGDATPAQDGAGAEGGASASVEQAVEPQPVEPVEGAAAPAPAQPDASPDAAAGEAAAASEQGPGSTTAQAAAGEATGDAPKRKRKRKRKRKPADGTQPEGEGAATAAPGDKPKKKEAHVPFGHLFTAGRAKRHAFAVGEVVAGRVLRSADGAIVVDLFGKALAVADEHEPREIPPAPQSKVPAPQPKVEAPAATAEEAPSAEAADGTEGKAPQAGAAGEVAAPAGNGAAPSEPSPLKAPSETDAGAAPLQVQQAAAPSEAAADGATEVVEPTTAQQPSAQDAADATPAEATVADATAADSAQAVDAPSVDPDSGDVVQADDVQDADEETSAGTVAAPGRALPAAPVVPMDLPRLEAAADGSIYRGRVGAVSESGHIAILNRNIDTKAVRACIEQYRAERRRVEGLVFGFNRGGFDILVEGVRGFCPASAMSLHEIADPNEYVGRKFEFLLPQGKSGGKDVVVSRRSILEREGRKKAKELLKSLKPGAKLTGRVTSVREFGLFVDIGGVEGLVHQSEMSFTFGTKPSDVAAVGDTVEVQVLRVGGDSPTAGGPGPRGGKRDKRDRVTRVSLSMKALLPDPWDDHKDAIAEGTVQTGKVTRTTDFGAFVELAPGIEGLLHITELGRDLKHANQAIKDGEEIPVIVERADRKARRISLSRLSPSELQDFQDGKLGDPSEAPKNLRTGAKIKVTIDRVEQRGIHVRIAGAIGKRARGYLPGSETGLERGSDLRKAFPLGEEVEIKVIGTDRDGGLRCSVKALQIDEERRAIKDYRREASKQGFGTFGDLLKAKLGGDAAD